MNPDITLFVKKAITKNCVYAVWTEKECLYVGFSRRGLVRPFKNYKLRNLFNEITRIDYWHCRDTKEALKLEALKRTEYRPILDRSGYYYDRKARKLLWSERKFTKLGNPHHQDMSGANNALSVQWSVDRERRALAYACEHGMPKGDHCWRCQGAA